MTHKRHNPVGVIPDWHGRPILLPAEILVEIDHFQELGGAPNPAGKMIQMKQGPGITFREYIDRKTGLTVRKEIEQDARWVKDANGNYWRWSHWVDGDVFFAVATDKNPPIAKQLLRVASMAQRLSQNLAVMIARYEGVHKTVSKEVDQCLATIRFLANNVWVGLVLDHLKASAEAYKKFEDTSVLSLLERSVRQKAEFSFRDETETPSISVSANGEFVTDFFFLWERNQLAPRMDELGAVPVNRSYGRMDRHEVVTQNVDIAVDNFLKLWTTTF